MINGRLPVNKSVQISSGSCSSESRGSNTSSIQLTRPLLDSNQSGVNAHKKCCRIDMSRIDWKLILVGVIIFILANVLVLMLVPDLSKYLPSERESDQTFCFTFLYYPCMQLRTPYFNVRKRWDYTYPTTICPAHCECVHSRVLFMWCLQVILCALAPIYSFWISIATVRHNNSVAPSEKGAILLPTFYYLVLAVLALDYIQMFSLLYADDLESNFYKIFTMTFRGVYRAAVMNPHKLLFCIATNKFMAYIHAGKFWVVDYTAAYRNTQKSQIWLPPYNAMVTSYFWASLT